MSEQEDVSYGRRLTEIAAERPDEVDLWLVARDGSERAVTWRELETRANQIARLLASKGVGKDSIVGLALPNCLEHIFGTLAVWKLGATMLPLRGDLPQWEMDRLLGLADPVALVSDIHTAPCPVVSLADLEASRSLPDEPLPDCIAETVNLIASSGSTGKPKLVVTPFRGVMSDDPRAQSEMAGGSVTVLVTSPLYHVNGFSYTSPLLLEGASAVVMEKFDAALAVELI